MISCRRSVSDGEASMDKDRSALKGILFILMAAFGFSLMSVFVRLAGERIPTIQKAFFRNLVALIYITLILIKDRTSPIVKKNCVPDILCRAVFGSIGLIANFYAVDHLVLSDATMLNKLSPFFAVLFSVFLLKEKPHRIELCGIAIALAGCVCIVKPSFQNPAAPASLIGLLGGAGAGAAYTFVRRLGLKNVRGPVIIFWFSLISCVVCLPSMILHLVPMTLKETLFLLGAGTFACVGQIGITKAYLYAPAKEISVYDYSQVLFAAVFGFILFDQTPDLISVVGYILIIGAGVGMFFFHKNKSAESGVRKVDHD